MVPQARPRLLPTSLFSVHYLHLSYHSPILTWRGAIMLWQTPTYITPSLDRKDKHKSRVALQHADTYTPILRYILKINWHFLPWYILITDYGVLIKRHSSTQTTSTKQKQGVLLLYNFHHPQFRVYIYIYIYIKWSLKPFFYSKTN